MEVWGCRVGWLGVRKREGETLKDAFRRDARGARSARVPQVSMITANIVTVYMLLDCAPPSNLLINMSLYELLFSRT